MRLIFEVLKNDPRTRSTCMAPVLLKGCSACDCGCMGKLLILLGCRMSKQGIRSLIYCLLICGVIWTALIIKILHVTGVFNG